jgi:hypothetical protein
MVSNTLELTLEELVEKLRAMGVEYAEDAGYRELRSAMPDEFPF